MNFIFYTAIFFSISIGFYTLFLHKKHSGIIYSSLLSIVNGICLIFGSLHFSKEIYNYPNLLRVELIFISLLGGFTYISTRAALAQSNRPKPNDLYFFIVPNSVFFYLLPFLLSDISAKESILGINTDYYVIFAICGVNHSVGIYFSHLLFVQKLDKKKSLLLKIFASIAILLNLFSSLNTFLILSGGFSFIFSLPSLAISIAIIVHRYLATKKNSSVYTREEIDPDSINSKPNSKPSIKEEVLHYLEKEKPFLNPDFQLKNLSKEFQISKEETLKVFSENFGKTFYELINEFKVQEAIKKLQDKKNTKKSITKISIESGFRSNSNFLAIFKKATGKSPAEYRKFQR
ncbi:MAG: helix-turn-helix domain-containing protein [Leptospiraceae bacterium]|nr:AraC family transcriptional regulator [Leptospiraceae bacterium]MCK6380073.1 helix-turn-helix domain-containing protein [Leptospiraceae bacterium]NUM42180.1 AraC family transcriptional regulator [Leptospiraceae bacterium]